jgi:hypothetical protein
MSKFNITKKISLHPVLGEGHENSVLEFKPMTFEDARNLEKLQPDVPELQLPVLAANATDEQKMRHAAEVSKLKIEHKAAENKAAMAAVDKAIEFIKGKFVSGKINGQEVVKEDFSNGELGVEVINHCMKQLAGSKSEDFTQG